MKTSDIAVIIAVYAVCALFFALTLDMDPAASTYPRVLLCALAVLNTLLLARSLIALKKQGLSRDFSEIFRDFQKKQFFGTAAAGIAYMVLMYTVGFYPASVLYLAGTMLFLKVPVRHIIVTMLVLAGMVYAVFTLFLKVPLPVGILFK